ncbi:hypothetical protein [Bartonella tamiae]|uniref:Uncharacterized protein n=1 Tax=Bartonella tamiae Th239 TaxID=1094558 RepID=J0R3Y5_9HYPH|nr:hypothetical protein [Bartonella tamiae]EJF90354.1 hypothetical protein ME5_00755 [Bartonella tamiae Th239]EJF93705.1 hypothetical protein MEG_01129 [Bartonella tamiae Th307]
MTNRNQEKNIKVIDVEAIDDADDAAFGPIDTVDVFDDIVNGSDSAERIRDIKIEDLDNPLNNEDQNTVAENIYASQPTRDEKE